MEKPIPRPCDRARAFCEQHGLTVPILLAPMAGACPASLSVAVAHAGGMGAMGALISPPDAIRKWVSELRAGGAKPFQLNTWIPDPPPKRDAHVESPIRRLPAEGCRDPMVCDSHHVDGRRTRPGRRR